MVYDVIEPRWVSGGSPGSWCCEAVTWDQVLVTWPTHHPIYVAVGTCLHFCLGMGHWQCHLASITWWTIIPFLQNYSQTWCKFRPLQATCTSLDIKGIAVIPQHNKLPKQILTSHCRCKQANICQNRMDI